MAQGKTQIITLTGRGGVGKTSIMEKLLLYKDLFCPVEGVTTRPARPSDKEWENSSITEDEFDHLLLENLLLVPTVLMSYGYAVRKDSVDQALFSKKIGVRILSLGTVAAFHQYARAVAGPGAVRGFYIKVSDPSVLPQRMARRGDNVDIICMRIVFDDNADYEADDIARRYAQEHGGERLFHGFVYNDNLEIAVASILQQTWA